MNAMFCFVFFLFEITYMSHYLHQAMLDMSISPPLVYVENISISIQGKYKETTHWSWAKVGYAY